LSKLQFIIQARTGSSRLPAKVSMNFFNNKSILEIIIEKLLYAFPSYQIIIATTKNSDDDSIEAIGDSYSLEVLRGSNDDVLSRFLSIIDDFPCEFICRICADNPFLDVDLLRNLILSDYYKYDYVSYSYNKKPVILTHFGFFGELVSSKSLKEISKYTTENKYREHVTNYLYEHPDLFSINLIDIPNILYENNFIRLTIDDIVDFELGKSIYGELIKKNLDINYKNVINLLKSRNDIIPVMKNQIKKYHK